MCDNLYVTKLCVCDKVGCDKVRGSVEVREEEEVHAGYRSKIKNPTQFCGEKPVYKCMCVYKILTSARKSFCAKVISV